MNAEDLMFGDFLRYKQDFPLTHLQGKIVKVRGIRGRVDVRTIDDGNFHESEHPDWLEPIPLTPEILEKNGFVHEENAGYVWNNYYGIIVAYSTFIERLRIIKDLNILFDTQDYADVFVHTLQHALRLCGIEKEIEL